MPELVSLQRVVADGYHNAFTDLTHWQGHYYLGYRHAQTHAVDPLGDVIILRSADLTDWEQVARFDTGGDNRDPSCWRPAIFSPSVSAPGCRAGAQPHPAQR